MVNAVGSTTDTTAAAAAMKKSAGMNKDDFLKLFVAQLQNQDPLAPQDPTEFLGQLAQLTQVEQAYNTTTALQNLLTAQNNSSAMNSVSFIGGTIKANGNTAAFDGSAPASLQFSMPVPTSSATVTISDTSGRVVRTATLGPSAAGDGTFAWDGRDNSGALLPTGAYSFNVNGTSASGAGVAATTYTTGRVDGVTFNNGSPLLTIGAASVALSDVVSVKGV
ncbi:MAG: flagellar hook assembly protein FlgD [Deltaproteobacteria bacterium]|nr:flagellar hook assembly protein FlgD [Deltaproteobacteria bacterium]